MEQKPRRPTITDEEALQFHQRGKPGKLEITPTKPMATQRDLSLAYSPGVAAPVRRIAEDPETAYDYTAKGNLVAVISNGTAILGLGDLGALASKPVMEGKAVLFSASLMSIRSTSRLIPRTSNSSSTPSVISAPPSAASISKTSRHLTASSSNNACAR